MCQLILINNYSPVSQANITDLQISSLTTRKKGHNPKSPEDDSKGGDLYMHLPTQHRLRKVRNTIYSDPGNPFDTEEPESSLLPSTTYVQTKSGDTDNSESWQPTDPEVTRASHKMEQDKLSMFSDPFDLVDVRTGSVSNRGTWSTFQSNRRSMSVDIGFLPTQKMMEQYSMSESGPIWPPDNIPTLHVQHPSGALFTTDTRRDTRFYDFYDDLLAEYGIGENAFFTHCAQQMLPIML